MSGGNASFRDLLDAEREQAAGVFAALEDVGVWVDSVAQRAGKPQLPTTPPSVADVYAGTPYG